MSDVRRVVYDKAKDLWIYEDDRTPATLADTMASLQERNLSTRPRRNNQWRNTDRVIFTLCKHCGRAISLNPAQWFTDQAGNFMNPDWNGGRYWSHFHLVDDYHLPEPKRPFVDHLIAI